MRGGKPKTADFRRSHLIQTMRANCKATPPKLSVRADEAFLSPPLFRLNRKSETMLDGGCSEVGLASHHVRSTLRITRSWAGVKAQPAAWRRWGSAKATALRERGNRQDQAEQVQPGERTRKTLTAIIKRNSQRRPWLPRRHRESQAEPAKLFQMRLNLNISRG